MAAGKGGAAAVIAHRRASVQPGTPCGDWVGFQAGEANGTPVLWLAVVDGLGHGAPAAAAADRAAGWLQAAWAEPALAPDPAALLHRLSACLQDTRGAAVGLACLHGSMLYHAGVGNTRCLHWRAGRTQRLPSSYGIVGEMAERPLHNECVPLAPGDWVLLFSDGLREGLSLEALDLASPPTADRLCELLMARWRLPHDDAAVLAACWTA